MANNLICINKKLIQDLKGILPIYKDEKSKAATSIQNAWIESIHLDPLSGRLYVKGDRLHTILRMHSKADGQYFIEKTSKKHKIYNGNEIYIATDIIIGELNRRMVGANISKRSYLTYSEEILTTIRDTSEIRFKQEEIREIEEKLIKKLKGERIKQLRIKKDELTHKNLKRTSAEFAHIRQKSEHRMYAFSIHNGLIVNKETHALITQKNIHDENELLDLCMEMKWDITWYEIFLEKMEE